MITAICPNPSVDKIYELDEFLSGSVNRCRSVRAYPGGKGVHVALALHELGTDTQLIGFWGGPPGEWIRDKCHNRGVATSGPVLDEWTRTCITFLSEGDWKNTEILENGPRVKSNQTIRFLNSITDASRVSDAVCISGSWPPGIPHDIYLQVQTICSFQKSDLWVDASGEYLTAALHVKPFGIHLNRYEAEQVLGTGIDPAEMCRKLLKYCTVVALTDGANGLYLGYRDTIFHGACAVGEVISSVGSGDCLTAGLLHAWYQGISIEEAVRVAVASGAANCVNPDLGMIKKTDVDYFKKQTIIKQINL